MLAATTSRVPELQQDIKFVRLPDIALTDIAAHMSDPRVAEHMPLLTFAWDEKAAADFVAKKEACWSRDGLGHWAFLSGNEYIGWGGFQKEGDEWDFGLVLRPEYFGLGGRIAKQALSFAAADARIPFVTFLLPPSRTKLRALERLGAVEVGRVDYDGAEFLKFRLDTE
ncbi:MAG: GNAT family N-acetyltransferase [Tateyamaria sp.]